MRMFKKFLFFLSLIPFLVFGQTNTYNILDKGNTGKSPIAALGILPLPGNSTTSGDATNGVIFNVQLPALSTFYAVKLVYLNYDTSNTQSWDGVKVAPAPKSISGGNSSLTFSSFVTVGGSQSFSVPVAVTGAGGQLIPGVTITDFIPVASIPRTDTPGAPPLLRVASHLAPSANTTNHPNYNGTLYTNFNALTVNPGLVNGTFSFSGSGATLSQLTSTGATTANSGGNQSPISAIFYYTNNHPDIWEFGDSIIQGQGTTTHYAGITEYVVFNSYSNSVQFGGANYSTSGQLTVDTLARLKAVIGQGYSVGQVPRYTLFKAWSPNDGNTTANFQSSWAYTLEMINYSLQKGSVPIVITAPFATGYSCSLIQAQNALVMQLPPSVIKIDLFSIFTPGCVWNPSYNSGDSIHPNDAGESAAANIILSSVPY